MAHPARGPKWDRKIFRRCTAHRTVQTTRLLWGQGRRAMEEPNRRRTQVREGARPIKVSMQNPDVRGGIIKDGICAHGPCARGGGNALNAVAHCAFPAVWMAGILFSFECAAMSQFLVSLKLSSLMPRIRLEVICKYDILSLLWPTT